MSILLFSCRCRSVSVRFSVDQCQCVSLSAFVCVGVFLHRCYVGRCNSVSKSVWVGVFFCPCCCCYYCLTVSVSVGFCVEVCRCFCCCCCYCCLTLSVSRRCRFVSVCASVGVALTLQPPLACADIVCSFFIWGGREELGAGGVGGDSKENQPTSTACGSQLCTQPRARALLIDNTKHTYNILHYTTLQEKGLTTDLTPPK